MFNRSRVDRARPVKPRHHHQVAGGDFGEKPAKLRPIGLGSARYFAKHCDRPGCTKLPHLSIDALAAGRDGGIAVEGDIGFSDGADSALGIGRETGLLHRFLVQLTCATCKSLIYRGRAGVAEVLISAPMSRGVNVVCFSWVASLISARLCWCAILPIWMGRLTYSTRYLTLANDVHLLVHRLAARSALFLISKREHPALVERLSEFIQDRGAVGLLLKLHSDGKGIEQVALSFWESRIEKSASRLEDIVTTAVISTLTAIVAGIIVEMWKGEFGPLKRLLREDDEEYLRTVSRKEPFFRKDLEAVLPFTMRNYRIRA